MSEERFQIGEYWLSKREGSQRWCATWFDEKARQTRRTSLGTSNFEEARIRLAEWAVTRTRLQKELPQEILLSTLFARYYAKYGKRLSSADVTLRALNMWVDYYQSATVADLTVERQEDFLDWMAAKSYTPGYIRRTISAGKAALNYAYKRQEIASVPYIMTVPEEQAETYKVLTQRQVAALFNACEPGDKDFMYLILAFNTLARPSVPLDVTPVMVDLRHRIINLLPPGRKQDPRKRRPKLPITDTLLPWLQSCDGETFVNYYGNRIANNKKSFQALCKRAKVKCTRYDLRHTMATELRRRGVPYWETEGWLGHRIKSTSERYAVFSPDYLAEGRKAIDAYFDELQKKVNYPLRMAVRQEKEKVAC
jgi:integrase